MNHVFTDPDLAELDRIWPLGRQLVVPEGGKVLVAGAYKGRYMDYVCTLYKPGMVLGYEPQHDAALEARNRVKKHHNAFVISAGIGVHDCMVTMENLNTDGCKVGVVDPAHLVMFRGIEGVLSQFEPVDLFICNMETYEKFLIPYLLGSGLMEQIRSLAIQFHEAIPNRRIWDKLENHYGRPVYDDYPVWCYFQRKE